MIQGIKLYICNINWSATEAGFHDWLTDVQGYEVDTVALIMSGETGRPRGFAFVTFKTVEAAHEALRDLEGEEFMGRPLHIRVAVAKPRAGERPSAIGRPIEIKPVMVDMVDDYDWGDK